MKTAFRTAALMISVALSACGGGGGGGDDDGPSAPANKAPTANFAFTCADLSCAFTSTSTDQDAGDAVATTSWNFGDGSVPVTTANPTHAFAAGSTYTVTLTAGDKAGLASTATKQITVTAAPVPAAPHAAFSAGCVSLDCTFTDTSTYDAGSALQSRTWDFGDGSAVATTSPVVHHYAATAVTTYTVTLTIVDGAGKISTSVQSIVAAPPATSLNCVNGNCVLTLAQAARVTATIVSHSCSAHSNQVLITAPLAQTLFADGCYDPIGVPVMLGGGQLFAAGTTLEAAVTSGTFSASSLVFTPSIKVTGDFTNGWTLTFDDGYGGPGEPDFDDLVILIKATP